MPKPIVCVRDTKVGKILGFASCFFRKMEVEVRCTLMSLI